MLKTIIISLMLYLLLSFSCFLVIDTHEVIFLSMSSDYDISTGIQVPPFPGRRALAEELLKNTPMNDIFSSLYFVETLYSVFGVARVSSLKNSYEIATRIADDFIARGYPLNRVDGQGCDSIRNAIVWKDKIAVRYFLDKGYDLPNSYWSCIFPIWLMS